VPLEQPDRQHWQAAAGYVELSMFLEADMELDKIDPFSRAAPEVLAIRLAIYRGLQKWELMREIAKRLADLQPNEIQWTISLAYATRRADSTSSEGSSAQCRAEVSNRGGDKIQSGPLFLSDRSHQNGRKLLKESF